MIRLAKKLFYRVLVFVDWVIPLAIASVVTILSFQEKVALPLVQTVTLGVLSLMCFNLIRDRIKWQTTENDIDYIKSSIDDFPPDRTILADSELTGIDRILPGVVDHDWLPDIRDAKNVTMVKIKAAFTNSPEYFNALESVLDRGGSVTIVVSDPRATGTLMRYLDEPTSLVTDRPVSKSVRAPWVNGLEELSADIRRLSIWMQSLREEGRNVTRLRLCVSSHYPTQAYLKFDNRLYVYNYPYMSRGFHAPCMLFTDNTTTTYQYLVQCMNAVIDSTESLLEAAEDIWQRCKDGDFSDRSIEHLQLAIVSLSQPSRKQ